MGYTTALPLLLVILNYEHTVKVVAVELVGVSVAAEHTDL
jgi:hypothetical protein